MAYTYEHPRPALTADAVIFTNEEPRELLLIQRKSEPFAGAWALPGGFVEEDESPLEGAIRELYEETGLTRVRFRQLGAYGNPGRDPRGWVVAVAFVGTVARAEAEAAVHEGDDAAALDFFPVDALPPLAFDHAEIVADALELLARDAL